MKKQLVNIARISISNFTFDSKTNTISFFSTKTNKCWSRVFEGVDQGIFLIWYIHKNENLNKKQLNALKKLCKNGNN